MSLIRFSVELVEGQNRQPPPPKCGAYTGNQSDTRDENRVRMAHPREALCADSRQANPAQLTPVTYCQKELPRACRAQQRYASGQCRWSRVSHTFLAERITLAGW